MWAVATIELICLPKLQYILRCSPCFNSSVIARYDDCIRNTLECILNVQLAFLFLLAVWGSERLTKLCYRVSCHL